MPTGRFQVFFLDKDNVTAYPLNGIKIRADTICRKNWRITDPDARQRDRIVDQLMGGDDPTLLREQSGR